MKLSFLIVASQLSDCLLSVINSIERAIIDYPIKYEYEILVSSFEAVSHPSVTWVEDKVKQPGNTVQAYNEMALHASGDYLFILNDDHMFPDSKPLKVIEHLQGDAFKDRKYKVSGIGASMGIMNGRMGATAIPNRECWINEPQRFPDHAAFPEELKDPRFSTFNHRYMIVGYPVFAKETVINHFGGYVFNPSFRHHWADNWLPLFVGETDGYTLVCEDTPFQWCAHPGSTSHINNDLYDYYVYCKLAVKLLKERCTYYELVTP